MKKETMLANDLAKKIVFDKNNRYVINCTPAQCIDIVEKALEVGVKVYTETERCPFDRSFPYMTWDGVEICQSSSSASFSEVDFEVFMSALSIYPHKKVLLNKNYTAVVNEDKVVVDCQEFPISVIKKIIETHEYFYGKAK